MNKSILIIAAAVVLCVSQNLPAEINELEKNAQSFAWKNINLGSTLLEIKKSHPKVVADTTWLPAVEQKQGVGGLALKGESGIRSGYLRTYEDKVYFAIIIYDYDDIKALSGGDLEAGAELLVTKLTEKLGPDVKVTKDKDTEQYMLGWVFQKVNRRIAIIFDDKENYARLLYTDTAVEKQIIEKAQKTADVGF
jgi:hypothetical protein